MKWVHIRIFSSTLNAWVQNARQLNPNYDPELNATVEIRVLDNYEQQVPAVRYEEDVHGMLPDCYRELVAIITEEKVEGLKRIFNNIDNMSDTELLEKLLDLIIDLDDSPSYSLENKGGDFPFRKIEINPFVFEDF